MTDLISIIVPVYNSEKTIRRCLLSILEQSYSHIECIIVDDGSTDKSSELIKTFQNDKRIKYYYQENHGVSAARNLGINVASGTFLMFVDSDDSLEKDTCEKMIYQYENNSVDLVLCGLNIYRNGVLLRSPHLREGIRCIDNFDDYWEIRRINLGPCNKLYKTSLINILFDETLSLGEDTKFVIDYLETCRYIAVIPDCLYNVFLDNNNSLNRKYRDDRLDMLITVREYEKNKIVCRYKDANVHEIFEEYFLDLHVILRAIIRNNSKWKVLFQTNIEKYNYKEILNNTDFHKRYYRIFAYLVARKHVLLLGMLVKLHIFAEKIMLRS